MKSVKLLGSLLYNGATLFETELDLLKSLDAIPSINKQSFNIENLDNASGDYTLGIKLPRTSNNDQFFNYIGEEYTDFSTQKVYKGRIELAGSTIIQGNMYLKEITPNHYDVTIIGDNISWAVGLKDKSLRDIQSLRPIRYTGVRSTSFNPWPEQEANSFGLADIWDKTEQTGEYDFNFNILSYGNFDANPNDASINPINGLLQIRNSAGATDGAVLFRPDDWPFFPLEFKTGVNLRPLLQSIFKDQGYTLVGTFINDTILDNLYLPFTDSNNADPRWPWALMGQSKFRIPDFVDYIFSPTSPANAPRNFLYLIEEISNVEIKKDYTYNLNDSFETATDKRFEYLAPVSGFYRIDLSANQIILNSDVPFRLFAGIVNKNQDALQGDYYNLGADITLDTINSDVATSEMLIQNIGSYSGSGLIYLQKDQRITPLLSRTFPEPIPPFTLPLLNNIVFEVTPVSDENNIPWSFDINTEVIADINQLELIKSLINMFNLYVTADNVNKSVSIDYFDNYFLSAGVALDWSDKTTYDISTKKPSINFSRVDFNLTNEEGEYYFIPTSTGYTYTNNVLTTNKKVKSSIFAKTADRNYVYVTDASQLNNVNINIPTLENKTELTKKLGELGSVYELLKFDYVPRILKYSSPTIVPNVYVGDTVSGEFFNIPLGLPVPTNVNFLDFNYLFENYYDEQFSNINTQYIITLPIALDEYDVSTFDARIPVKIGQQLYYVNLIEDFNPLTLEPAKCNLLRK